MKKLLGLLLISGISLQAGKDGSERVPSPELDVLAAIAFAELVTGFFPSKNSEESVLPAGLVVDASFVTPALQPQAVAQAVPAPQAQAAAYVGVQVPKGSFACGICGKVLSNSTKKAHMMVHNGVKPFACQSCPYVTSYRSALKGHMRTHTGEKPHNCLYCKKSFTQGSTLRNHIKTHTGVTPYACSVPDCDYRSSQKGNLRRHMSTHNN